MPSVYFHAEGVNFELDQPHTTQEWVDSIIAKEDHELGELNFIFCNDQYLHEINMEYLEHDTLTDIITFDQSEEPNTIEGDVFISIDRVRENARDLGQPFEDELHRVIAHGVLHLLGYNDKTAEEVAAMRKKEEACLSLRAL